VLSIIVKVISLIILVTTPVACQAVVSPEATVQVEPQATPTLRGLPSPLPTTEPTAKEINSPVATPVSPVVPPTVKPTERGQKLIEPTPLPGSEALITRVKEMLTQLPEMGIRMDDIEPVTVEARQWRDSSLGCPRQGMIYNQVITPGYLIVLIANDRVYEFHTNTRETVVLCFIDGEDAVEMLRQ
jgi:hypothetical protein